MALFYHRLSSLPITFNHLFLVLQGVRICLFVLLGDFSVNISTLSHTFTLIICNIIDSFSLFQCVSDHNSLSTLSLTDLVFVSQSFLHSCVIFSPLMSQKQVILQALQTSIMTVI